MGAVQPALAIGLAPVLDEHLRLDAAAEPLAIQQLVPQLAIEAFDEAVLPRTAWRNEALPTGPFRLRKRLLSRGSGSSPLPTRAELDSSLYAGGLSHSLIRKILVFSTLPPH